MESESKLMSKSGGRQSRDRFEQFKEISKTIRFRMLGLVVFSILMPSVVGGWMAVNYLGDVISDQVYNELSLKTETIATDMSNWLTTRSFEVRAFTSTHLLVEEISTILASKRKEEIDRSVKSVKEYLSYLLEDNDLFSGFSILSSDGEILLNQPDDIKVDFNFSIPKIIGNTPILIEASDSDVPGVYIAQFMGGARVGSKLLFISHLDIEALLSTLKKSSESDTSIYILDRYGDLKGGVGLPDDNNEVPDPALTLRKGRSTPQSYRGIRGESVVGAGFPLNHMNWSVIMEVSSKRAFAPLRTFRRMMFLMTIILACILFVPALILSRTISRPLEELSRVSKKIREGHAGEKVQSKPGGELGEFITTFNSMSLSMEKSMEEINKINEQLTIISVTDPLTGLSNRRFVEDHLKRELKFLERTGDNLTVLMLDIDRFKEYNDTYGHIAGDEALKQLAEIMTANVRVTDIVSRFGGEEFLICMGHTTIEGGKNAAQKLRRAVENNVFRLKGQETRITASIGLATAPDDGTTIESLVDAADKAMYAAKDAGRNRVRTVSEITEVAADETKPPVKKPAKRQTTSSKASTRKKKPKK